MSIGIRNFHIEKDLEDINDPGINDNFVGVFPANEINSFIDYKS